MLKQCLAIFVIVVLAAGCRNSKSSPLAATETNSDSNVEETATMSRGELAPPAEDESALDIFANSHESLVLVAYFDTLSRDGTGSNVVELLMDHNIVPSIVGSRALGVSVLESSAERARKILADAIEDQGLDLVLVKTEE